MEEFDTGGKLNSASQQSETRSTKGAAGEKLIRGLNQQLKNSADGALRPPDSFGRAQSDHSNNYMRSTGDEATAQAGINFGAKPPHSAHGALQQPAAMGSMSENDAALHSAGRSGPNSQHSQ